MVETENTLYMFVANGITTTRFLSATPELLALRERVVKHEILGPRIYAGTGYRTTKAEEYIAAAKAAGYDLVGEYLPDDAAKFDSVVAAIHRVGMPIGAHAPTSSDGLDRAIRAGYSSVEHLWDWVRYAWTESGGSGKRIDEAKLRSKAAEMQRAGVWTCPTLGVHVYGIVFGLPGTVATTAGIPKWPELRFLTDSQRQSIAKQVDQARQGENEQAALRREMEGVYGQIIRALQDSGGALLLGTDAISSHMVPGFSVHRELQELVRIGGLTPYEALATGTRNVAAYFGTQDSTGTVAVGKRADLVLLADNPLTDIRHTMQPAGVMLGGRWLPRAELEAHLATFEGGKWRSR